MSNNVIAAVADEGAPTAESPIETESNSTPEPATEILGSTDSNEGAPEVEATENNEVVGESVSEKATEKTMADPASTVDQPSSTEQGDAIDASKTSIEQSEAQVSPEEEEGQEDTSKDDSTDLADTESTQKGMYFIFDSVIISLKRIFACFPDTPHHVIRWIEQILFRCSHERLLLHAYVASLPTLPLQYHCSAIGNMGTRALLSALSSRVEMQLVQAKSCLMHAFILPRIATCAISMPCCWAQLCTSSL